MAFDLKPLKRPKNILRVKKSVRDHEKSVKKIIDKITDP